MAKPLRVFVPIGTTEYIKLYGVPERTARRRIAAMPGAFKTPKGWRAPLPATAYARLKGISASTARRRGIRAATPDDAQLTLKYGSRQQLEHTALAKLNTFKPGVARPERIAHATPEQLTRVANLTRESWLEALRGEDGGDWEGDDEENILYYH